MRHNDRAGFAEVLVAVGVIVVPLGVDDELNRLIGEGGDSGDDLVGELGKLVIHDKRAVLTGTDGNIPAAALQHIDARGHARRRDLNLAKVLGCYPAGEHRK